MKHLLVYVMVFAAIVLPTVFFVVIKKDDVKSGKQKEDDLPPLFRLLLPVGDMLDRTGIGMFFCSLFRSAAAKVQTKLDYANFKLKAGQYYCIRIVLVMAVSLISATVTTLIVAPENRMSIPVAVAIAAFIGLTIPGVVLGNIVQERRTAILRAIPYSIDLVSSAMRGGLDFSAAIRFYVELGVKSPLVNEYGKMLREMELGVLRIQALQNMADRIQIKEFTSFVAAIALGTELGAPLSETMEIQGEEMRKARFAIAECKAQRAPSLMLIPMALFILPAVFITILTPVFLKMKEAGVPLF